MTALRKISCGTLARPAHRVDEPAEPSRGGREAALFGLLALLEYYERVVARALGLAFEGRPRER
jgi:hypothetical protein